MPSDQTIFKKGQQLKRFNKNTKRINKKILLFQFFLNKTHMINEIIYNIGNPIILYKKLLW